MKRARIAITLGEPAGIGPELVIALAQEAHDAELIVIADPELLRERATLLNVPLTLLPWDRNCAPEPQLAGTLKVLPVALQQPSVAGELNVANSTYVLETLRLASAGSLQGDFDAIVTAPVQKSVINEAGISFTGHTEYFQEKAGVSKVVMMLACPGLRVALATTHLPLRAVADAITPELLVEVIHILHKDLRTQFGIKDPRILVTGLNPHAGENGHLGMEEIEIIEPTLKKLRAEGINLIGPLPADTLFTPKYLTEADAVLAMYHDQGLPVLKHKGFGNAVNITLGLPFIRTSVDHGTALDLAGKGIADVGSLKTALQTAIDMVAARNASH